MNEQKGEKEGEINEIILETKEETNKISICDFCKSSYNDIDKFSCNHKICPKCLFQKIFISNIKDVSTIKDNLEIKCKCSQGILHKTIDDIYEINNKKNKIYEKIFQENNIDIKSDLCPIHNDKKLIYYCINCCEEICESCKEEEKGKKHKILDKEYLIKILKKEISELKMNYPNKESFNEKWNELCIKLKENTQIKFNEMILKIEEVNKALNDFKNLYENIFKQEIIKAVKILKLYIHIKNQKILIFFDI